MPFHDDPPDTSCESADQYARACGCFLDHRRSPFSFASCLRRCNVDPGEVDAEGLIYQPELASASLPFSHIDIEHADCSSPAQEIPRLLPPDPFLADLTRFRELKLSPNLLDLGSLPSSDLREYFNQVSSKLSCDLLEQWIPMSIVDNDRDEGLIFPSRCEKLRALLLREVENEKPSALSAESLERFTIDRDLACMSEWPASEIFGAAMRPLERCIDPITPPLSPLEENISLEKPSPRHMFTIDLTSEPSDPDVHATELWEHRLGDGRLESDPTVPSSDPCNLTSELALPPLKAGQVAITEDLKVEVPVVLPSSDQAAGSEIMPIHLESAAPLRESLHYSAECEQFFQEALESTLKAKRDETVMMVEQERLNPMDSLLRVAVPRLDFQIEDPEWAAHLSCAKDHLDWLQNGKCHGISLSEPLRQVSHWLKWSPISIQKGYISLTENLDPLAPESQRYLLMDAGPSLSSSSFICQSSDLIILRLADEDEIETPASGPDDTFEYDAVPRDFRILLPTPPSAATLLDGLSNTKPLKPVTRERAALLEGAASFLSASDTDNTAETLLNSFMQFRAPKRRKLSGTFPRGRQPEPASSVEATQSHDPVVTKPTNHSEKKNDKPQPVVAPPFDLSVRKSRLIVSLSLDRLVLQNLETEWPKDLILDRDYSRYDTISWSPGNVQRTPVVSPLAQEADITLAPGVGIIVTTLLKVKQRPLPGSRDMTPLRERVSIVCQRYDTLIVLVSEVNPEGEFSNSLPSSDMAAYSDFARFATALKAEVVPYFVGGARKTMSRWILALMCHYSRGTADVDRHLSSSETTWEVFLRRAGMNVMAALILAGVLFEQYGPLGLATFIRMSVMERLNRYSKLLGGDRLLLSASEVLDRTWS